MPIACLKCGHENPIMEPFCIGCGTQLKNQAIRAELAHMDIKLGKIKDGVQQLKEIAEDYIKAGRFKDVDNIIRNLMSIHPDDIDANYLMGQKYLYTGEYDLAEKAFRKVLMTDISNAKALVKLGETLSEKGDEDSAIIAYRKVMKLDENRPEPYEFLIRVEVLKGNKKEAIKLTKKLSEIYKSKGDFPKSKELSDFSLELSGKKPAEALKPPPVKVPSPKEEDGPPPEDMEVMGLHLPDIELTFSDEADPFAPPLDNPPRSNPVKEKLPDLPPCIKDKETLKIQEEESEPLYSKTEIFLAILREHGDYNKRYFAILNLNPMEGEAVVETLVDALQDESRMVRTQAAIALGSTGDVRVLDNLIEAMEKDDDSAIRQNAISIIGQLGDPKGVDVLIKALKDKDGSVRKSAVMGLGAFNEPKIIDPLIEYLETGDTSLWGNIVPILASTGDSRIVKPFIKVFEKTQELELRLNIISILKDHKDPSVADFLIGTLLGQNNAIKISAMKALGDIGDKKAIRNIEVFLTDKDTDICKTAQEALAKLGYTQSPFAKIKSFLFKKR